VQSRSGTGTPAVPSRQGGGKSERLRSLGAWAWGLNPPPVASGARPLVNAPSSQPASGLGSHHGPCFPSAIPRSTLSAAQNRAGQSIPTDGRVPRHDVLGRRVQVAIEIFVDCHTRPSPCVSDFLPTRIRSSVACPRHAASPARASGWSEFRPWEPCPWEPCPWQPCPWEVCPWELCPSDTGRSQDQPVPWRTVGDWPDGRSLAGTLPIGTDSDSSLQPARRNSRCPGSACGPIRPVAVPSH
jgi:hypothetical protein